jgi:hypothetical protein
MKIDALYPYLVVGPTNPLCVPVGHGVWAELCEDRDTVGGIVHAAVTPDHLRGVGLTAEAAHARAIENLAGFADDSPDLSIEVLGGVGEAVHLLVYCDHPRAAACLLLPDLYEQACDLLKTTDVCAVVPQRESLVVLPKRDRAYRERVVGMLREQEADAAGPISFALFELTVDGVREFVE